MLLTDLGSYVTMNGISVLPWPVLLRAGVEGAVFKGAQEDLSKGVSTLRSIQQAYDGGAKTVGCFYWDDPTVIVKWLLDSYSEAIIKENPEFISVDIEQSTDWSGNPLDPNFLNDHAQALTEGLASNFPHLLMLPYSAKYMVQRIPKLANWIDNFDNWTAAWPDSPQQRYRLSLEEIARGDVRLTLYDGNGLPIRYPDGTYAYRTINIKDYWQATTANRICLLRQYSSRILLPWNEVGGTIYDHQYDFNYTDLDIDGWKKKIKKEDGGPIITTMTSIWDTNVLQKDRAKIFTWNSNQVLKVPLTELNVDAIILPMGGMDKYDGSHWIRYTESTFAGRFEVVKNANLPAIGKFNLHGGMWLKEQHTANEVDGMTFQTNYVLKALLDAWHIGTLNWSDVLAKKGNWRSISALILSMVETDGFPTGKDIGNNWQTRTLKNILEEIQEMMVKGYLPNIPVILYTGPWWLNSYDIMDTEFYAYLQSKKAWLYLDLGQWTLFSSATFPDLDSIFAFRPADIFTFNYKDSTGKIIYTFPKDYDKRILIHEYVGETQKVQYVQDVNGNPMTVSLSLWQNTKDAMLEFLKYSTSGSGSGSVITVDPAIEARLQVVESEVVDLKNQLATAISTIATLNSALTVDEALIDKMDAYLKSLPKY